jgi:hypothetical protein
MTGPQHELRWSPPGPPEFPLDPECLALCVALNEVPGIETTWSCCGHGTEPFRIRFDADCLEDLADLLDHRGVRVGRLARRGNWRLSARLRPLLPHGAGRSVRLAKFIHQDQVDQP